MPFAEEETELTGQIAQSSKDVVSPERPLTFALHPYVYVSQLNIPSAIIQLLYTLIFFLT